MTGMHNTYMYTCSHKKSYFSFLLVILPNEEVINNYNGKMGKNSLFQCIRILIQVKILQGK